MPVYYKFKFIQLTVKVPLLSSSLLDVHFYGFTCTSGTCRLNEPHPLILRASAFVLN